MKRLYPILIIVFLFACTKEETATEDLTEGWNCVSRYVANGTLSFANQGSDNMTGDGSVIDTNGGEVVIDLQTYGSPNTFFIKGDAS